MWVIRGGDDDRLVDRFVDEGVTGLLYPTVPDAEILSRTEMRPFLAEAGGTSAAIDGHVAMLSAFVNEIQVGESVLMPDVSRGEVVIGEVTGRYVFDGDLPPEQCRHRRTVTWLVRHPVADLPAPLRKVPAQRKALLQDRAAEWSAYVARVRAGELGRDPKDRRAATRSAAAPRARAPRAAPAAKPAPVLDRACPSCHLRKPAGQFRGDLCVDCAE
jgi:hypothetical protein